MAKIKLGAIVVDMRGKLGGHVFAQNRGGNYVRTKTTPINPRTAAQTLVRVAFATISAGWSQLTVAARTSFNSLVAAYAKTNVFGDLKNPTGKALFQRLNQNLVNSEQAQITLCVNPTELVGMAEVAVSAVVAGQTMSVAQSNDLTGQKIIVYGTPQLTNGTNFVKNKLRVIGVFAGGNTGATDIAAAYTAKFGAFVLISNIAIGVKTVNANGQATPLQILKVAITAV